MSLDWDIRATPRIETRLELGHIGLFCRLVDYVINFELNKKISTINIEPLIILTFHSLYSSKLSFNEPKREINLN